MLFIYQMLVVESYLFNLIYALNILKYVFINYVYNFYLPAGNFQV